jgi:hypothetical protein
LFVPSSSKKGELLLKPQVFSAPASVVGWKFEVIVKSFMAAQDAAQMDVAIDVCLFELVHHLAYMTALQKAAGLTPMQLEPFMAKQIGGFAKARA